MGSKISEEMFNDILKKARDRVNDGPMAGLLDVVQRPTVLDHVVLVSLQKIGWPQVEWKFVCHAPEGARCRLTCAQGCEEWDSWEPKSEDNPHFGHTYRDSGECQMVLFANLDETDIEERYRFAEDETSVPVRSGLVELKYEGDGLVTWKYAELFHT